MDQTRRDAFQGLLAYLLPQPYQVFVVALDFRLGTFVARGPHDDGHAVRNAEIGEDRFQTLAVLARRDLAGNAAAARRIRHQHAIAAGQRQVCRQGRALVAAFLLDHLDQQDLAALDHFLDLVFAAVDHGAADFLRLVDLVLVAADFLDGRVDFLVLECFLSRALRVFFLGDEGFAVGNRNLVVVGMNFAES